MAPKSAKKKDSVVDAEEKAINADPFEFKIMGGRLDGSMMKLPRRLLEFTINGEKYQQITRKVEFGKGEKDWKWELHFEKDLGKKAD